MNALEPPGCDDLVLALWREAWPQVERDRLFTSLRDDTPWRQERLRMFGREVALPRLTAWYGDHDAAYRYSGIDNVPLPWTPLLTDIRDRVERLTGSRFNSVLLNFYRHGDDHVSWHADNEAAIDQSQGIASVSFGAARRFQFERRDRSPAQRFELLLPGGSLLHMKPPTQQHWRHRLPKTRNAGERINLTFRCVSR